MNKKKPPTKPEQDKEGLPQSKRKQQIICLFAADSTSRKSRKNQQYIPVLLQKL